MRKTPTIAVTLPLLLRLAPVIEMSDRQLFELCQLNRDLRIERTSRGDREKEFQSGRVVLPLCPDFVVELRSPSDVLENVQAKMQEYRDNGAQLGWLIDPLEKKVYISRPQAPVECLDDPQTLAGDPVLPGFVLEVRKVWDS